MNIASHIATELSNVSQNRSSSTIELSSLINFREREYDLKNRHWIKVQKHHQIRFRYNSSNNNFVQDAAIVFLGVIVFGLLHGINPSHGWTVAVLYSVRNKRPLLSSLMSSSILAGAHFLSSIVVVAAFIFVTMFIQIAQTYLDYAVAVALGILAYLFWKEKGEDLIETQHGHLHHDFVEQLEHEHAHWHSVMGNHTHMHLHQKRSLPTLAAIAGFALVLGFAHEEEFVILTLAVGGINPLLLMIAYATAVAAGLIGITVLAVKLYSYIQHKVIQYTKYLPKISALILAAMAVGFAVGLL